MDLTDANQIMTLPNGIKAWPLRLRVKDFPKRGA